MDTLDLALQEALRRKVLRRSIVKHADHDQSRHGDWARGLSGRQIYEETTGQGGATIQVPTGNRPTTGYAVAVPDAELAIDLADFDPGDINAYRRQYADILAEENTHLGLWVNPDDGRVYLDISRVVQDRDEAIRMGEEANQYAIFNLETFETIDLGVRERVAARYAG